MATTSKQMFIGAASVSDTSLYTVPSSTTSVVTEIVVANTAGTAATFTLNLKGTAIAGSTAIAANSTTVIDIKQVLNATETITGSASATTVKFFISGVEIA
jgi:hypothetical protein